MRITKQLTEVLVGGGCCCCCCCEAVVAVLVLLLDDSAVEAVADMGTCATLICQHPTQRDGHTANELTAITPYTALM